MPPCLHMRLCTLVPQATPWYVNLSSVDARGRESLVPQGELCELCGITCESWPLIDPEQLASQYHTDRGVKLEFDSIRARVTEEAAERRSTRFLQETVSKTKDIAMEVSIKYDLVTTAVFTSHWQPPETLPGVKVVSVPNPEGGKELTGVLFQRGSLPVALPRYTVKLKTTANVELQHLVLAPTQVQRSTHAKERFQKSSERLVNQRPPQLKAMSLKNLLTYGDVNEKFKAAQGGLEDQTTAIDFQQHVVDSDAKANVATSCIIRRVGGNPLDEEEAPDGQQDPKPVRKRKAAGQPAPKQGGGDAPGQTPSKARSRQSTAIGLLRKNTPQKGSASVASSDACVLSMDVSSLDEEARELQEFTALLNGGSVGRSLRPVSSVSVEVEVPHHMGWCQCHCVPV